MPRLDDLTIIYVLDPPALTRDSVILLSSIRKVLGDVKVIAYTPEAKREHLFPYITEFHERMGAEIRFMSTEGLFELPYKQGNKIAACMAPRDTPFTLFLDTDTAIVTPFDRADLVAEGEVAVVPEGVQGWGGNPGAWEYVYERMGLPFPEERVRLARSGKMSPPYFNAGMVAFPDASGFGEAWYRVSRTLDDDPAVKHKRPWLDQIALPLALRMAGLQPRIVGDEWNLSLSQPGNARHVPPFLAKVNAVDARIVHFHRPKFLHGTRYAEVVDAALAEATVFGSVAELTASGDERARRRDVVWNRFGALKDLKTKTPEEAAEFKALKAEKAWFKSLADRLDLQAEIVPDTIVKPL